MSFQEGIGGENFTKISAHFGISFAAKEVCIDRAIRTGKRIKVDYVGLELFFFEKDSGHVGGGGGLGHGRSII